MFDFTNKGIPWIMKYYEVFDSRQEAVNREKTINQINNFVKYDSY